MNSDKGEKQSFDKLRTSGEIEVCVNESVIRAMQNAAEQASPNEACGILLGEGNRITGFEPAKNVHPNPESHFEIDPQSLIDAHRNAREGGSQVLGYFHSHPSGDAVPSETDRAMSAGDGLIWAIVGGGDVQFWHDSPDGFETLSYTPFDA